MRDRRRISAAASTRAFLLAAVAAVFSSSATAKPLPVATSGDSRAAEEPGCLCAAFFDPVCGVDGITYSNSCHAICDGALHEGQWTAGECGKKPPPDGGAEVIVCGHISNCIHVGGVANRNKDRVQACGWCQIGTLADEGYGLQCVPSGLSQCAPSRPCPGTWIAEPQHCPPDEGSGGSCGRISQCDQLSVPANYNKKGVQTCGWCQLGPGLGNGSGLPCDTNADGLCGPANVCTGQWVADVHDCLSTVSVLTPTPTPTPTPADTSVPTPGDGYAPLPDVGMGNNSSSGKNGTSGMPDNPVNITEGSVVGNSSFASSERSLSVANSPNTTANHTHSNDSNNLTMPAGASSPISNLKRNSTDNSSALNNSTVNPPTKPDLAITSDPNNTTKRGCSHCADTGGRPVCGRDRRTYMNRCEAVCFGVEVEREGDCFSTQLPMKPPDHWTMACLGYCQLVAQVTKPRAVCSNDGVTYASECEAHCYSASLVGWMACECFCADDGRVVTEEGELLATGAKGCKGPDGSTGQGWCYTVAPCHDNTKDVFLPGSDGVMHTVSIRQCRTEDFAGRVEGSVAVMGALSKEASGNRKISP